LAREGEPRLLLESIVLGVIGALGAQVFLWLLKLCNHLFLWTMAGYRPPTEGGISELIGPHGLWLIPLVTTLGGLLSGLLVYGFAPEAEGHGTDTVVHAFHRKAGLIRSRVPPLKALASAITIGSGGAAGREGPIALTAAGLGSIYAKLAHCSEEERRLLTLIGMAAGLSAVFRTPLGTGVFAIEVLYGNIEFEISALLYTMVSSSVAYAVNGLFSGFEPLFRVPLIATPTLPDYGWYLLLGLLSGVAAAVLPEVFYLMRDLFRSLPLPDWSKPALGGLGVGLIALGLPQVLGGGYGWIQKAIEGQLALSLLLALALAKMAAFSLTVSSGGSGGVFAPSLYIGAMLGGSFAMLAHLPPAAFVIVGMAAVFGAAARVPIATMLMVTEMAGGYHLLVPAGAAVMISYLLQQRLSASFRYRSLYEGQVPMRQNSPAHHLEHIQLGLTLLKEAELPKGGQLGHIDVLRLLRLGVMFDLPEHKQFTMALLREDSPYAGQTVQTLYQDVGEKDFEVAAIVRNGQLLTPHLDTQMQDGDSLLVIASQAALAKLAEHVGPLLHLTEKDGKALEPKR
jgi:CIC family chloride channel protein